MLRRLALRNVALVTELELELGPGFSVLTGETGAGKSILVEALQLALGARAESSVVREGTSRAEVSAEFDTPASARAWLHEAGFDEGETVLLRRTVDEQGRSRAWVNGSSATVGQLRELAEHLVEIHGQHAWQGLTRAAGVRAVLDHHAGADTAALGERWQAWRAARQALQAAREQGEALQRDRERLQWQLAELDKLGPREHEWEQLEAEHRRLANAQALLESTRAALLALSEGEPAADALVERAAESLAEAGRHDPELLEVERVLREAQAQVRDASRTLQAYLSRTDPDPARLAELDARLASWLSLARRHRQPPAELPALRSAWAEQLRTLDLAADVQALEQAAQAAEAHWREAAEAISGLRRRHAPKLARAITQAMQQLGMAGGRLEVELSPCAEPQPHGLESVEFLVAGHAGSSPRPLGRVASGGELSRLALAVATTTARQRGANLPTLVFDEIDTGVGGTVADSVGRLLKELGGSSQVLAVTHLAQVAACADTHFVVTKSVQEGRACSQVQPVSGEARVGEVARMLGGERLSGQAHAQAMLGGAAS